MTLDIDELRRLNEKATEYAASGFHEVQLRVYLRDHIQEILEALKAVHSHHEYGPASPGEQDAAWAIYCRGIGWDINAHPAAKNAFCEGFCAGDLHSEGDEAREVLRAENRQLKEKIHELTK